MWESDMTDDTTPTRVCAYEGCEITLVRKLRADGKTFSRWPKWCADHKYRYVPQSERPAIESHPDDRSCCYLGCNEVLVRKDGCGPWPERCPTHAAMHELQWWQTYRASQRAASYEGVAPGKVCAQRGCQSTVIYVRQLCEPCYKRARSAGILEQFPHPVRICTICGGEFRSGSKALYCSRACINESVRKRRAAAKTKPRACEFCDAPLPVRANLKMITCSDSCKQAWHRIRNIEAARKQQAESRKRNHESVANGAHRRRMQIRGSTYERIDLAEIWARDFGMCWICNEPIDPDLEWPHRRSKSLDHVIPVVKGGEHVRSNVAYAHLGCNMRKHTKVLDYQPFRLAN